MAKRTTKSTFAKDLERFTETLSMEVTQAAVRAIGYELEVFLSRYPADLVMTPEAAHHTDMAIKRVAIELTDRVFDQVEHGGIRIEIVEKSSDNR